MSADGETLLLLGGRFQFTEQGIVDRDARGNLITEPEHGKPIRNPKHAKQKRTGYEHMGAADLVALKLEALDLWQSVKVAGKRAALGARLDGIDAELDRRTRDRTPDPLRDRMLAALAGNFAADGRS